MKLALTALLTLSCGGLAWAQTQPQMDTQSTQSESGATQMPTSPAAGGPMGTGSPSTMPTQPGVSDSATGTSATDAGTAGAQSPSAAGGSITGSTATGSPSTTDTAGSSAPREVTVDLTRETPPPQDPRAAREEAAAALRYARTEGCRNAGSREAQRECLRQAQADYREALGQSTPLQRSRH